MNNCRIYINERSYGGLCCQEIAVAEVKTIKKAQQEAFHEDYNALVKQKALPSKSKLLSLKLVLDEDGLFRTYSRLRYVDYLPFDARFPDIPLSKNSVTSLIVKSFHEGINHSAGTNHTLSLLSSRFWIMQARDEIREVERECCEYQRRKSKAAQQIMAPILTI